MIFMGLCFLMSVVVFLFYPVSDLLDYFRERLLNFVGIGRENIGRNGLSFYKRQDTVHVSRS